MKKLSQNYYQQLNKFKLSFIYITIDRKTCSINSEVNMHRIFMSLYTFWSTFVWEKGSDVSILLICPSNSWFNCIFVSLALYLLVFMFVRGRSLTGQTVSSVGLSVFLFVLGYTLRNLISLHILLGYNLDYTNKLWSRSWSTKMRLLVSFIQNSY